MQGNNKEMMDAAVHSEPRGKEGSGVVELSTDERLDKLEKQAGRVEVRLSAVEKSLQEIKNLLKQQGMKPGKNYDAP